MKILSVSVVFPPAWQYGGTPVAAHQLAKAMIQEGQHVFVICTGGRREHLPVLDQEIIWNGVPVVYCARRPNLIPFYSPSLQMEVACRAGGFDIALIRSSWTYVGPAASKECRAKGLPYVAYPEGNFESFALQNSRLKKKIFWHILDRSFFEGSAAIVALTKYEAESIRRMDLTSRIEVIPNGVDVNNFAAEVSRGHLERKFPQFEGRKLILFLGRIHPIKGLINLVKAFRRVHLLEPEALLVIAGPNEDGHKHEVEICIKEQGLEQHIVFAGPVFESTKIGLLKNADVFVLPSYSEGFPIGVLEALACKLPVVVTKNCHVPEIAMAGAGVEVDARPDSIAKELHALLSDDLARKQMGNNGYQLAVEHFSWKRVAKMTSALCKAILSE